MKKRLVVLASALGVAGLVAAGSVAALGGAVTNPEADTPAEPVTQRVYDAAYAEFRDCMKDAGVPLACERTVGAVHEFSYLADGQSAYDKCYPDFAGVDFQWQVANSYDSPTYVKLRECLTEGGVQPGKDVETVWAQVQAEKIDVDACTLGVGSN
jgi:hypothetical protein